jgi:hypothetical protein
MPSGIEFFQIIFAARIKLLSTQFHRCRSGGHVFLLNAVEQKRLIDSIGQVKRAAGADSLYWNARYFYYYCRRGIISSLEINFIGR